MEHSDCICILILQDSGHSESNNDARLASVSQPWGTARAVELSDWMIKNELPRKPCFTVWGNEAGPLSPWGRDPLHIKSSPVKVINACVSNYAAAKNVSFRISPKLFNFSINLL